MIPSPTRKVYEGVADRRQMFRMFGRHAQRPNRFDDDAGAPYRGEWFEIDGAEHDYMLEILPPLWMRGDMFAMSVGSDSAGADARRNRRAGIRTGAGDDTRRAHRAYLVQHP